jgi:short-subunit dehydrogenase
MPFTHKPISEQVIVITGASSGIGLATARAAAAQGARLVLAARGEDALREIEQHLRNEGAEVVTVAADVGDRAEVERIATAALERFGGFDTWVNNAGHSIYGKLEEVSLEDSERIFQTNFWGVVHGSLVALRTLKPRGGALINIGSVTSDYPVPLQGMYSASKHAVKGFTDALRMELQDEQAPVSVTLIKPTSIDTPFPQHARNYMKEEPKLPPPVYAPEEVAMAILYAATHPKREIYIGGSAKGMTVMRRAVPAAMDRVGGSMMVKQQRRHEPPRNPEGTLYRPGEGGRVRGDHPGYVMRRSFYTRSAMHPVLTSALVAAAGAAALAYVGQRRRAAPANPLRGLD